MYFSAFAGTRYPSSHPHPGPGRTFGVPAVITGSLKTVSAPADQTGALLSPRPRGYGSPGPPQVQLRPRALRAVARRRLRCWDAAERAGETSGEKEPGWPRLRAASGRVRGPNSRGAGAARGGSIRARADAVRGAANRALVHQGAAQSAVTVLPAPQKLANAG